MRSNNLLSVFDEFFDDGFFPTTRVSRTHRATPSLNVEETDDAYIITSPMPGIEIDDLKIELNDHVLSLSYEHSEDKESKDRQGEMLRQEFSHYSFSRSVTLPKHVDQESIKALYKKGILKINIEKLPEAKPKSIDIQVED